MFAIHADKLVKTYKTSLKREGLLGGVRDLFDREYKEIKAVDNLSLKVNSGEFIGYIGPNGAGKSTSIKMLTGILQPTSGEVSVLGFNPFKDRKSYSKCIGVVFGQRTQLWWDIAVSESFELLRRIYDVSIPDYRRRLDYLVNIFDVRDLMHIPVRKLSLGQRMKCDIIASLLHEPQILFLDEPTIGLDAIAKNSIREILKTLHAETKTTIILTTHDLMEIEELCKRIIVLDRGMIVHDGTVDSIREKVGLRRVLKLQFFEDCNPTEFRELALLDGLDFVQASSKSMALHFEPHHHSVLELLGKISQEMRIKDISIEEPSIEEVVTKIYRDGRVGTL